MSGRLFFNRDHLSFLLHLDWIKIMSLKTKPIGFKSGL